LTRVQLLDVSKRYGSTLAVDNVSADIADGEFVTLLGPSGCGKTTTLRMVAGLVDLTSGLISEILGWRFRVTRSFRI
jgi:ABC-type Fe3+/spermidine/putrescine transport system ATPase subunit